jgi:hypothetical protein
MLERSNPSMTDRAHASGSRLWAEASVVLSALSRSLASLVGMPAGPGREGLTTRRIAQGARFPDHRDDPKASAQRRLRSIQSRPATVPVAVDGLCLGTALHAGGLPGWLVEAV